MTEAQIWRAMAKFTLANHREQLGLCELSWDYQGFEGFRAVRKRLYEESLRRPEGFWWPVSTKRGAERRAAWCRAQAAKCSKPKASK